MLILSRRFLDKTNDSSGQKYNDYVVKLNRWVYARWIQGLYPLPLPAATMFLDVDLAREPNSNTMLDHERTTKTAMPMMREHREKYRVGTMHDCGQRQSQSPFSRNSVSLHAFHRRVLFVESNFVMYLGYVHGPHLDLGDTGTSLQLNHRDAMKAQCDRTTILCKHCIPTVLD